MSLLIFLSTSNATVSFKVLDAGKWRAVQITPRGSLSTNGTQLDGAGTRLMADRIVLPGNPAAAAVQLSRPAPVLPATAPAVFVTKAELLARNEGVPPGGLAGQVLTKTNDSDFQSAWKTPTAGSGGGGGGGADLGLTIGLIIALA